jgi:hypothetical protein
MESGLYFEHNSSCKGDSMKQTIIIALVSLVLNCGFRLSRRDFEKYDKPVYISDVVGDVIDSNERETYELFPGVGGFIQAVSYLHPSGGYQWEIFTKHENLVAVNRDPEAMLILADYIDRYKLITESGLEFEEKWNIVDYDILGQPITQQEIDHLVQSIKQQGNKWTGGLVLFGCLSGTSLGCILGIEDTGPDDDPFPNISISKGPILVGAAVGTAAGLAIGLLARGGSGKKALETIKEGRRPRVVE